jgi:hypothetical protein
MNNVINLHDYCKKTDLEELEIEISNLSSDINDRIELHKLLDIMYIADYLYQNVYFNQIYCAFIPLVNKELSMYGLETIREINSFMPTISVRHQDQADGNCIATYSCDHPYNPDVIIECSDTDPLNAIVNLKREYIKFFLNIPEDMGRLYDLQNKLRKTKELIEKPI